jgi:type II restriction enzyme
MQEQDISFYWITDWLGWWTSAKPLEEAYNKMEWNIYNIEMLKGGILNELIK